LVLPWSEAHLTPLLKLTAEQPNLKDAPVRVIISPTHRRQVRRWSLGSYAQLSDWLEKNWHAAVVWIWGPGEEAEIDQGLSLCKQPAIKAPKTTFSEMTALIANSDLFIGNSNGPSHVAVATGTPSLQLHGHTSARAWCPMTSEHAALQAPGFGIVDMPDINGITLDDVTNALSNLSKVVFGRANEMKSKRPILNGGR